LAQAEVDSGRRPGTSTADAARIADLERENRELRRANEMADSYDNAMAETTIGLFKAELHRNPAALAANGGPWRGLDDLEVATCGWVAWFNQDRLHSELGDLTPVEVEAAHYRDHPHAHAA
jgi:putative transposase